MREHDSGYVNILCCILYIVDLSYVNEVGQQIPISRECLSIRNKDISHWWYVIFLYFIFLYQN